MYYIMIGAIIFVIGICLIIAGFIINDDTAIVLITWGLAGVFAGALIIVITLMDKGVNGNKTINENSTEIETVTETQTESAANSAIKVALMQNYPEAEIISNENDLQHGIFIYNNENYNFEVEDNILFIKQDKKLIKYIYLN
jgi:ABC-type multidrug transport system fused ATPase/permease subunit